MKLTFFGAARAVTGSCHCVECGGKKILVDCGLQQGRDERDNQELDFAAGYIDAVVVTHAHIDHSGRIPLLVKQGFTGNIYCTRLTGQLLSIMLRDSAHIQESDAQWQNQKGKRAGEEPVEPLYTVHDAEEAVKRIVTCEYGTTLQIADGVKVRFVDAGHLLGSASVEMWLTEGDDTRKVVFSGDIGNRDQPIIRDPQYIRDADYVLTESTYGDRLHDMDKDPDYTADLAAIIDETLGNGGNVIIPSFAVGRTQELLYFIREMKEQGLVKSVPGFSVVVDSPLAGEATRIFSGDLHGYLDEEAIAALKGGALFQFPGLTITESSDESRALNLDPTPKVIISASGMCDAGRIRHHLKHNLWRPECAVVFVGYQAEGSLGRPGRPAAVDRALQPPAQAGVRGPRRPGGDGGLRQHPPGKGTGRPRPKLRRGLRPAGQPDALPRPAAGEEARARLRRLAGLPAPGGCGPQAHGGHRPQQGRHQQGSGPVRRPAPRPHREVGPLTRVPNPRPAGPGVFRAPHPRKSAASFAGGAHFVFIRPGCCGPA